MLRVRHPELQPARQLGQQRWSGAVYLREAGVGAGPDAAADDAARRVAAAHEPRHVGQGADLRALPALRDLLHWHPLDVLWKNITDVLLFFLTVNRLSFMFLDSRKERFQFP